MAYLIIFIGVGLGGALRHLANVMAMRLGHSTFVCKFYVFRLQK